jgi:serine/threonine-protein kinase TNNI3K
MALGVARGMVAFEGASPAPILHRDLKPSNVFVDGGGAARVADAGLARWLLPGDAATLTGETGTYAYMAPEVFRHEVYGPRADTYSFGVLLVELLAAARPYADALLTPAQVAAEVAAGRLRPAVPANAPPAVAALAAACLDAEPGLRPPFASIVPALARALADLPVEASTPAGGGAGGALLTRLWGSGSAASEKQ